MDVYKLDPAHYYTSTGLKRDALLKKTGVCLELSTNYDKHLFITKRTPWQYMAVTRGGNNNDNSRGFF